MKGILEYLNKKSKLFVITVALLLAILLAVIDYLTGPEIGFSIFYLLPISLVVWSDGVIAGVVISFICSVLWFLADTLSGSTYSHPAIGYWAANMRLGYFLIISYLIGTAKRLFMEEKHLASTDYLTGVTNSRSFYQLAGIELERARRYKHPLTFAYIDVDNFKTVNDNSGHTAGDNLLRLIAENIKDNIRLVDMVGRLGGDEFAILLPETDYEQSKPVIRNVHKRLSDTMQQNRWDTITFSIGVITFVTPPDNINEMISKTDNLMYSAKNGGKNMIKHEVISK